MFDICIITIYIYYKLSNFIAIYLFKYYYKCTSDTFFFIKEGENHMANNIDTKITNALFDLLEEKEYQNISITDIVNKAGLSRVTYYRHFKTKEDIVLRFFKITKDKFIKQISLNNLDSSQNYELIILGLFLFFKANIKANKCLRKAGLESELLKFLSNEFLENLPVKLDKYVAYFVAGALYNVLINWLDNDCKDSIDVVSKPFIDTQMALAK